MAAGGHSGCPKFTFDRISGHFRSIGHFGFPKFTFDRNSGHFRSIQKFFSRWPFWMSENHFGLHFWPFQIDQPFWMSEIHFQWHFWPFHIHTELYLIFLIVDKMAAQPFWMSANNFRLHFWPFQIDTQLVRDIWMSNTCVKFDESSLNPSKVIALTTL